MAGSILQELISKYPNVSREVLNEHCSSDLANKVARKIDRWRELAPYLSLEDAEMSEIECDNKKEMERRLETLRMWKRKCGSSATHRVLVEAFLKCQRVDLAETVFNLLEQRSTSFVCSKAQDQIFGAVNQGDAGKVAQLLGDGLHADIQQADDGSSPLSLAAYHGNVQCVRTLLNCGASVDIQKKDGFTPLMIASLEGFQDVGEILIQHGANVDLQSQDGNSALMLAVYKGHLGMVQLLLNTGANPNLRKKDSFNALMMATIGGDKQMVDTLLEFEANVNQHADLMDGSTALTLACDSGAAEIVDSLLQYGADVNAQKKDGFTALKIATHKGYENIVQKLVVHKQNN